MRMRILALAGLIAFTSHANAAAPRTNWVVSQLYSFNHPLAATNSVEVATKMTTMATSPYTFYRGTDHLFFQDMLTLPASGYANIQTGYTWLGGDTHIGNFDAVKDSAGAVVFKVSDFDEGYLGQYTWDLRRLAASMVLAGRETGVNDSNITTAINTMVGAYVDQMSSFKGSSAELTFQLKSSNTGGAVKDTITAAAGKTRASLLSKYTQLSGTTRTFQNLSNLTAVDTTTYNNIKTAMSGYVASIAASKQYSAGFYTVKDIHRKLGSGVGSLGKMRYYVLVQGPSTATTDDVILEMKQTISSSVALADNGQLPASAYGYNEANRVAKTAKAQLINAERLIGYTNISGIPYYVHEKSPFQEDFDYTLLDATRMNAAAIYLGQALAAAHALADQDYDSAIVSYSIDKQVSDAVTSKSGLKAEMVSFAFDYANQVQLDWQSFVAAKNAGTPLY
ncbi:MAG: DUF2252 family protein [Fluviicoccus sp.]|uniref:DUF2252 domain-containing protein n=1 Tax=Fluviicoccus sp. TaxID=2003552 RepID=UPI00271EF61F|nr:DUF2252 family protein [Fluviicoccus sp.]MDO8329446.1 DUF2252 family protein [Fluviicoccus sp.]